MTQSSIITSQFTYFHKMCTHGGCHTSCHLLIKSVKPYGVPNAKIWFYFAQFPFSQFCSHLTETFKRFVFDSLIKYFPEYQRRPLPWADRGIHSQLCQTALCSCLEVSAWTANQWVRKCAYIFVLLVLSVTLCSLFDLISIFSTRWRVGAWCWNKEMARSWASFQE